MAEPKKTGKKATSAKTKQNAVRGQRRLGINMVVDAYIALERNQGRGLDLVWSPHCYIFYYLCLFGELCFNVLPNAFLKFISTLLLSVNLLTVGLDSPNAMTPLQTWHNL